MRVVFSIISTIIKSVIKSKVENELSNELVGISVDDVSEKGLSKINDFINNGKTKIENILSEEKMKSMGISEDNIAYVIAEVKGLLSEIEITDDIFRQCKYDSLNLCSFMWKKYSENKTDYIECESDIKKSLLAISEALIKIMRESEEFVKDISIQISNTVEDSRVEIQKISDFLEENFSRISDDNQRIFDILRKILEQNPKIIEMNSASEEVPIIRGSFRLDIQNGDKIDLRIEEISEINLKFENGNNVVFLYGRPGIGKTTLARLFANEHCKNREQKNTIYFVKYETSIENTMSKLSVNNKKYKGEDILKYWETLKFEERNHILLIIDNFNENTLQGGDNNNFESEVEDSFFKRLKDLGIRILITTRIKVNKDVYEVLPVNDTMNLFERYLGYTLQIRDRQNVEQIIRILKGNTMLITLLAHLWERSDQNEKDLLLDKIINCEIHKYTKNLIKEADVEVDDLTIYGQTMALLDFSGILRDESVKEVFVNVSLLPLEGLIKDTFNEFIGYSDGNILESLIRDSWVLEEENRVFLHPFMREIVRENGYVTYKDCENYCKSIKEVISKDQIMCKFSDRIAYKEYAWEIFRVFSLENNMDIVLVDLFYWLSDIYDELAERSRSLEIAKIILNHLDVYNKLTKAERMSGIAYSMNNSYKNMGDLEKAESLLYDAVHVYEEMDIIDDRIRYNRIAGKIKSNFGSNYIAKSKCNQARKDEFLKKALEYHMEALNYRKDLENRYILETSDIVRTLKSDVAISYTNIATVYFYLGQYERAIENHSIAEEIRKNLGNIKSLNDNQERIIGCIIQMYKNNFYLDRKYIKKALDYYPELLESNYKNKANKAMKININNFIFIARIVLYDRRYVDLYDDLVQKATLFINWLEENLLLETQFAVDFRQIITEMNTNKIYEEG